MADILINYRRKDSSFAAHRLYDELNAIFPNQVFIDIDKIAPAADFHAVLRQALRSCTVMLSLIGQHWSADNRLEDPQDWVRLEIESALSMRQVTVVPILLDGAQMPGTDMLPPSIGRLAQLNGVHLEPAAFSRHVREMLVPVIEAAIAAATRPESVSNEAALRMEGDRFRDDDILPLLVIVPRGRYYRGSAISERSAALSNQPQTQVTIANAFAASVFPVTAFEWNSACMSGFGQVPVSIPAPLGGVNEILTEWSQASTYWRLSGEIPSLSLFTAMSGIRDRLFPATGITWHAAQAYCEWASGRSGAKYRLMSESEWEYSCRARTQTRYATGDDITFQQAHFNRQYKPQHLKRGANKEGWVESAPRPVTASFQNAFGLFGMHGNVWEWVEDCHHPTYEGAPTDQSAWVEVPRSHDKVVRGGCFASDYRRLGSANRGRAPFVPKHAERFGFRVARDL